MESVKINSLELENVKRIKAVKLEPSENGLTIIGGDNNQGKTSVLDAIAWALGGSKFKPSNAKNEGSALPPKLTVTLSNGLIVERKGEKGTLKVIDPEGKKSGQGLLDTFIEELALNLPKFMNASNKEKANTLLNIIGVGDVLIKLDMKERSIYEERTLLGRERDRKQKYAEELPSYEDAPLEEVSASELIKQQQEILARNGENQKKRDQLQALLKKREFINEQTKMTDEKIKEAEARLKALHEERYKEAAEFESNEKGIQTAQMTVAALVDESTAELEANIRNIDMINQKVRKNVEKQKAQKEADDLVKNYEALSNQLAEVRKEKLDLLKGANLPLEGLSVEDNELTYKGKKWDSMSASEQLKVSTAIVRKIKPNCGFVLIDKLEQMDMKTLNDFCKWLETENLQAIGTRVSQGDECSIIIEDGLVKGKELEAYKPTEEVKPMIYKF